MSRQKYICQTSTQGIDVCVLHALAWHLVYVGIGSFLLALERLC
jgi:hypothetical protein